MPLQEDVRTSASRMKSRFRPKNELAGIDEIGFSQNKPASDNQSRQFIGGIAVDPSHFWTIDRTHVGGIIGDDEDLDKITQGFEQPRDIVNILDDAQQRHGIGLAEVSLGKLFPIEIADQRVTAAADDVG